jgi:hypothetical protein
MNMNVDFIYIVILIEYYCILYIYLYNKLILLNIINKTDDKIIIY